MMDEKKLLDAMSDIDENYIQDAKNFRERKVVRGRFAAKSVSLAAFPANPQLPTSSPQLPARSSQPATPR